MAVQEDLSGICRDPAVRGGRACIAGRRIAVTDIVKRRQLAKEDLATVADYYGIALEEVNAALAYYRRHREAIDAEIREDTEFEVMAEELGIDEAVDWLLLRRKHAGRGGDRIAEAGH